MVRINATEAIVAGSAGRTPASDPILKQVRGVLTADKTIKIEVQGHTYNVGSYGNQFRLARRNRPIGGHSTVYGLAAG
jgi:flagellar motor protein MotB